jgi:hypothetical protein
VVATGAGTITAGQFQGRHRGQGDDLYSPLTRSTASPPASARNSASSSSLSRRRETSDTHAGRPFVKLLGGWHPLGRFRTQSSPIRYGAWVAPVTLRIFECASGYDSAGRLVVTDICLKDEYEMLVRLADLVRVNALAMPLGVPASYRVSLSVRLV